MEESTEGSKKFLLPVNLTEPREDLRAGKRPDSRWLLIWNSFYILLNIGSVVGIVLVNKLIFSVHQFPYIIHFTVTFVLLFGLAKAGLFEIKSLPVKDVIGLSVSFCGFVLLTNLSLKYNSVAFYQMAKVLTTPIVGLIQYFHYGIEMRLQVRLALGFACIGVLAATFKEVQVSPVGSLIALVSVISTAIYQVLVGAKQKELQANSMQLLLYQSPISAALLALVACPVLEGPRAIIQFRNSPPLLMAILGSSLLAAMVNVSTFLIIGHTSPITYNVVGHAKLCLVLLFGFLTFGLGDLNAFNLAGIAVALFGIIAYSIIMLK